MKNFPFLIIPIEIKVRDFMSRLLLAVYAVSRGFNVIIGSQQKIINYLHKLPKGIYFDKSLALNKSSFYKELTLNGFKVCSLDEEGLSSLNNYQKYITQRVSSKTLEYAEKVFTWGESEARKIIEKYPQASKKITITGNPRIDLLKSNYDLKYQDDALKYNSKYGDYIFFPSNFTVNHALGRKNLMRLFKNLGRISNQEDVKLYNARLDYFDRTFKEFVGLVLSVAKKFEDTKIIVRPHPAEDISYWHKITKEYNNIYIKTSGEAAGWIKGSKVIVHSSCTTGLEAFVSNKPVIAFLPYEDHEYSKHISNSVSTKHNNIKDVIHNLESIINGQTVNNLFEDKREMLLKHVNNINDNDAFTDIIHELEKIEITKEEFKGVGFNFVNRFKFALRLLKSYFFNRKAYNYGRQKFPGITKKEFERMFFIMKKTLKIDKKIILNQITKDLFILKNK